MKTPLIAIGMALMSVSAFANESSQAPSDQTVVLGSEQTYSVADMKARCALFQSSAQLKPFDIRIECERTENTWEQVSQTKPLPRWVSYGAMGLGKGRIQEEKVDEQLESQGQACLVYREKTIYSKANLEMSCNEFIRNADKLVSLCRDGFEREDGTAVRAEWQQVGEAENGKLLVDGCAAGIQQADQQQSSGQEQQGSQAQSSQQGSAAVQQQ